MGSKSMDLNFVVGPGLSDVSMQTAQAMTKNGADVKNVTLVAYEEQVTLPQGNKILAFTFNGTVPSPTIRMTQVDILNVTMINYPKNKLIHSSDHHASIISAVPNPPSRNAPGTALTGASNSRSTNGSSSIPGVMP